MFVIFMFRVEVEPRVSMLTMKNLSQPGVKWEKEGNRCSPATQQLSRHNPRPNISKTLYREEGEKLWVNPPTW